MTVGLFTIADATGGARLQADDGRRRYWRMDLRHVREQYQSAGLDLGDLDPDPIVQFRRWFAEVEASGLWEPNAMVVSTVDEDGWPAARIVLLKWVDERGFVFFTNYDSDKGRELAREPRTSLTFFWTELRRQVRVRGVARRLADADNDGYFATRPRGSQLGAWASPQSRVVTGREALEARFAELDALYDGAEIPRPPHWGGFGVEAHRVEFWQGRENRLHDRLLYERADGSWSITRLGP